MLHYYAFCRIYYISKALLRLTIARELELFCLHTFTKILLLLIVITTAFYSVLLAFKEFMRSSIPTSLSALPQFGEKYTKICQHICDICVNNRRGHI